MRFCLFVLIIFGISTNVASGQQDTFRAVKAYASEEAIEADPDKTTPKPQKIPLWNQQRAPIGNGKFEKAQTWITVHRPAKSNGTAIVICPGGGYGTLETGPEGHGIAKWLNGRGIAGVVLEYRLPKGRSFVPLVDAQRALRTVRANAHKWNLNASRIGVVDRGMHPLPDPGLPPTPVDRINAAPLWEVMRQCPPLASRPVHVENRVDDLTSIQWFPPSLRSFWQQFFRTCH